MKRLLILFVLAVSFGAPPPALAAPVTSVHSTSTIVADGIATGTVRLSTVAVSGLPSFATRAWVKSVGDWFVLGPAVGSAQPGAVVTAADGRQWVRQGSANRQYSAAAFWAIDEANGSDENQGWGATQNAADAAPLKTMAELNRRLVGSSYSSAVVFHQLSSLTSGEVLSNLRTSGYYGRPSWQGERASTDFSGALTTYTAAVPSANTGIQITMASLPVSWTASGLVGKLIESTDHARYAWILKDLGAKTARITTPTNANGATFAFGTAATFTPGETLNVVSLVTLPTWPFPAAGVGYAGIDTVNFIDGATFDPFNNGSAVSLIARTKLSNGSLMAAQSPSGVTIEGALISAPFFGVYGGVVGVSFCGVLSTTVVVQGTTAFSVSHGPLDLQASKIQLGSLGANFNTFGVGAVVSIFDATSGAAISFNDYASFGRPLRMNSTQPVYGSGNTVPILTLTKGGAYTLLPPALWYVTTSAAQPLVVDGVNHPFSDIPFRDATTGTFVNLAP